MADQTAAQQAVAEAQAALAAAQATAAQEAKDTAAEGESQAALDAEAALGKGVGGHVADLIRRVEALEQKVFPSDQTTAPEAASEGAEQYPSLSHSPGY